jgi:hypothetical protein
MKWATRVNLGLNRPPCIWFIRRFLDPEAEILYFEREELVEKARAAGAVSFHGDGTDLSFDRPGGRTTLDGFLTRYEWAGKDPALDLFAAVLNDASFRVPTNEARYPVAYGIRALNQGLRASIPEDGERLALLEQVYEGLYRWCQSQVAAPVAGT